MSATPSTMLKLGTTAPSFSLKDTVTNKELSLDDLKSAKAAVVMFICNHCPYVVNIIDELVNVGNEYKSKGVSFVAISSNDVENYPEDSPQKMKELAEEKGFPFPYLYDETQEVAKSYKAACTPDIYVFDSEMKLVYRGQIDDSRPGNNIKPSGSDLRNALDNILAGKGVSPDQTPSIGCNIKWKR